MTNAESIGDVVVLHPGYRLNRGRLVRLVRVDSVRGCPASFEAVDVQVDGKSAEWSNSLRYLGSCDWAGVRWDGEAWVTGPADVF